MTDVPEVGQVWADNDPRVAGRTFRIDRIEGAFAYCTVLSNSEETQEDLDRTPPPTWSRDARGRTTRIKLARLKPTSTGYRLLAEKEG